MLSYLSPSINLMVLSVFFLLFFFLQAMLTKCTIVFIVIYRYLLLLNALMFNLFKKEHFT